ncbi:hypothetical protein CVD28_18895 [Bacillus sp. M6-12]|uniref:amidohydrolase family protein n=1 Tax=Bacillus sp. M6-12 TaxID=2054166 RepID=UPI000C7877C6|nr:amidohydrolase family protein [Bacillus sp. M6-12]PLS16109.1 hypothetical protein CVD28_18895 [Bacillus sp. M6-12]
MLLKNANYLNADYNVVQGNLLVKEGKIIVLEDTSSTQPDEQTMDCREFIIIPGLYNSHFHGYSLSAKGIARDIKIEDWCNDSSQGQIQKRYFDKLDNLSSSDYQIVLMKAYIEMVKQGIVFTSESEPQEWPDLAAESINKVGLKGLIDTHDKIADYHNKKIHNISFGTHLLEEEDITDETLANCETIKQKYDSIHLTHCMENDWRKDLIFSSYGKSSVELYKERDLLDHKTVLYHGVHLNEKDITLLAETGASVVHCPVSNYWTAAGIAPVSKMLEKGVNVCLGTDFASVDIWETMKISYFLLKNSAPIQRFTAEDIFKMATKNGAAAYQLSSHGSIEDNFAADMVFIKKDSFIPDIQTGNFSTAVHNLMMETNKERIHHVMVDGEWIMYNRELKKVDEETINQEYQIIVEKLYSGITESMK